jgi:hypothetical protein
MGGSGAMIDGSARRCAHCNKLAPPSATRRWKFCDARCRMAAKRIRDDKEDLTVADRKAEKVWAEPEWTAVWGRTVGRYESVIGRVVHRYQTSHRLPAGLKGRILTRGGTVGVAVAALVHDLAGPDQGYSDKAITEARVIRAITNALEDFRRSDADFVRSRKPGTKKRSTDQMTSPVHPALFKEPPAGLDIGRSIEREARRHRSVEDQAIGNVDRYRFVDSLDPLERIAWFVANQQPADDRAMLLKTSAEFEAGLSELARGDLEGTLTFVFHDILLDAFSEETEEDRAYLWTVARDRARKALSTITHEAA